MSSAVSLIPARKAGDRKRRPTFRPAGKSRKPQQRRQAGKPTKPSANKPQTEESSATKPQATVPQQTQTTQISTSDLLTSELELIEIDAARETQADESQAAEPRIDGEEKKEAAVDPIASESQANKPSATEPITNESDVTEPSATEPIIPNPKITETTETEQITPKPTTNDQRVEKNPSLNDEGQSNNKQGKESKDRLGFGEEVSVELHMPFEPPLMPDGQPFIPQDDHLSMQSEQPIMPHEPTDERMLIPNETPVNQPEEEMPAVLPPKKKRARKRKGEGSAKGTSRKKSKASDESGKKADTLTGTLRDFCSRYRAKDGSKPINEPLALQAPPPSPPPQETETTPSGPMVQIINGEIVLQESSMIDPNARKTVAEVEEEFQHVVEEDGHTSFIKASYHSFVKRTKPKHWKVSETKLFYTALRQVGTDFATMEAYFENRTRKQLKRKYQIESIKNPHLISLALDPRAKIAIDLDVFKVDKDSIVVRPTDNTPVRQPNSDQTGDGGGGSQAAATDPQTGAGSDAPPGMHVLGNKDPVVEETDGQTPRLPDDDPFRALFGSLEEEAEKPVDYLDEFHEMEGGEPDSASTAVLLAPVPTKSKSKRPKFKASRGRQKRR